MSEYVMVYDGWAKDFGERMDDLVSRFALYFRLKDVMHERRREPIVRCRDCKYGRAIGDIGCVAFQHVDPRLQPKDPNGFCAWGEPKVVEPTTNDVDAEVEP